MSKKNSIPMRADKEFKKLMEEIKIERIKLGTDQPLKPVTTSRLTLATSRLIKKYPQLKKELVSSKLKWNLKTKKDR